MAVVAVVAVATALTGYDVVRSKDEAAEGVTTLVVLETRVTGQDVGTVERRARLNLS